MYKNLKKKLTPMMEQYLNIKSKYKNILVFYRLGDFYELFYNDAKVASKILGIVLTKRRNKKSTNIPMCGIPHHSSTNYINKLLKLKYSVAICEQLETPEEAKKRSRKSIIKREVVKIFTPGTIVEENFLNTYESNFLMSISSLKNIWSISWIELSTGDFYTIKCSKNNIKNEIVRIRPKEIIVNENFKKDKNFIRFLKTFNIYITYKLPIFFDYYTCYKRIIKFYKINSLKGFNNFHFSQIISSGLIIEHILYTQRYNIPRIKILKNINKSSFMEIDSITRKNLEIETTNNINKNFSLLKIIDKTITSVGKRLFSIRLNAPLCDIKSINKRYDIIDFFLNNTNIYVEIRRLLCDFFDLPRAIAKIYINKANPLTLKIIEYSLFVTVKMKKILFNYEKKLNNIVKKLIQDSYISLPLYFILNNTLIKSNNISLEKKFIRNGINKSLDQLYFLKYEIKNKIVFLRYKYVFLTKIKNLKINKNNILGFFLESNKRYYNILYERSFIHKQTLGSTTRFETEELKNLEINLLNVNVNIKELQKNIFNSLCMKVKKYINKLDIVIKAIADLDFYTSLAYLAEINSYVRPSLHYDTNLYLKESYHPIISYYGKNKFIPNDCNINNKENLWLITGPNMAGKSTYLRQIAILCILAQIGSFVPARIFKLGIVDKIFSRIGALDNITEGESTFMVEMNETAYILNNATKHSLVILDEIGRGTSTLDGVSIAWSVLCYLNNKISCRTLFATHYDELSHLTKKFTNIVIKQMAVKKWFNEVIFLYKLISGKSANSFGIYVAEMAGLPKEVINHAYIMHKLLKKKDK